MLSRISLQRIGGVLMGDEAGGRRRGAAVAAVVHTRLTLVQPPAKESFCAYSCLNTCFNEVKRTIDLLTS